MTNDVFICHSSKDAKIAMKVCKMLEKDSKISCWIAPRNIVGGKLYAQEIIESIENTRVLVLIFSANANNSNHVLSELNCAFNAGKVIIPFCVDDSVMSRVFMYYANPNQAIMGHPKPEKQFIHLKEAVIKNIPQLSEELERQQLYETLSKDTGIEINALKSLIENAKDLTCTSNKSTSDFDVMICYDNDFSQYTTTLCDVLYDSGLKPWDAVKGVNSTSSVARQICTVMSQVSAYICIYNGKTNSIMQRTTDIAIALEKPMFLCYIDSNVLNNVFTGDFEYHRVFDMTKDGSIDTLVNCLRDAVLPLNTIDNKRGDDEAAIGHRNTTGSYDMLQNAAGEILIVIEKRESSPDNPRLLYDGGDRALLYRSRESAVMINNLKEKARPALMAVDEILVAEIEDDEVAREYKVPVRMVKSLKELC